MLLYNNRTKLSQNAASKRILLGYCGVPQAPNVQTFPFEAPETYAEVYTSQAIVKPQNWAELRLIAFYKTLIPSPTYTINQKALNPIKGSMLAWRRVDAPHQAPFLSSFPGLAYLRITTQITRSSKHYNLKGRD